MGSRKRDRRGGGGPLILFFNDMFGELPDCGALSRVSGGTFTRDRKALAAADAIVFHIPTLRGLDGLKKPPGQLWVAWSMESEVNYPQLADPCFMSAFDVTMTYRRSADIWCPYLPDEAELTRALAAPPAPKDGEAPAVLFQSAATDRCGRNAFARDLMAHMPVHSFGRFLNNRRLEGADLGPATKIETISRYKFCLAFENSVAPDYVTEKFFQPFLAGTVPVYRGAPDVADFAPGDHCYIDASEFRDAGDLAAYLLHLDRDEAEYRGYLAWRERGLGAAFEKLLARTSRQAFCRLCGIVAARLPAAPPPLTGIPAP